MTSQQGSRPEPRTAEQRRRDTEHRLEHDVDLWVAGGDAESGEPSLIPLSFLHDGSTLLVATLETSPTGRNLAVGRPVRLGLGHTRDVIMIDATVTETISADEIAAPLADAFAVKTQFDPRTESGPYRYFRLAPHRIQAWRESNEIAGRTLMVNGRWR